MIAGVEGSGSEFTGITPAPVHNPGETFSIIAMLALAAFLAWRALR